MLRKIILSVMLLASFVMPVPAAFNSFSASGGPAPPVIDSTFTCIRSLASGTCGAATAANFNAVCDGVTNDKVAFNAWVDYAQARIPLTSKLYVPAGSNCYINQADGLQLNCLFSHCGDGVAGQIDLTPGFTGIISGYGATIGGLGQVGGFGLWASNAHDAVLTANAVAGDSTIQISASLASRFSVGDWVCVSGLALQDGGAPQSWAFFEYHKITNIATVSSTTTITLDGVLTEGPYKTTYPQYATGGPFAPNLGGPGTVFRMMPSWDVDGQVYGLVLNNTGTGGGTQVQPTGRKLYFQDVYGTDGLASTVGLTHTFVNSYLGDSLEIDKEIVTVNFIGVTAGQTTIQSSSFYNLNISNSTFTRSLNGTARATTIANTTFTDPTTGILAGATGYGQSRSLTLDHVSFTTNPPRHEGVPLATMTYDNAGTFTMSKASIDATTLTRVIVPGFTYYWGDNAGTNFDCLISGGLIPNKFQVLDLIESGGNFLIVTDLPGAFPTVTCEGFPVTVGGDGGMGGYQVDTFSTTASGPGDLTSNPEFIPPP